MQIYIQSRGFDRDADYGWWEVTSSPEVRIDSEDLPELLGSAIAAIDSEAFSLVLSRQSGELLLLISGLEPPERLDIVGRQIRIAVAWIVEDTRESERISRAIALAALQPQTRLDLTLQLAKSVILSETGFGSDRTVLKQIFISETAQNLGEGTPEIRAKIAKNSLQRQQELAAELHRDRLPERPGILVAVTGIKKAETLKQMGVWRGLSNLIKTEEWEKYDSDRSPSSFLSKLFGFGAV